ncbi:MAG: CBS domain-containing protein [bacterium]|nr:CBS domain-containing protein [bacterium]
MGSEIRVGDIMKKDVISIEEDAPITEVAKLMEIHDIGSVVVAKNKKAEGIITEKDIIHQVVTKGADASKITAKEIMSAPLKVVRPGTTLEEAAKMMRQYSLKRFPVVNEDNELVGMISEGDVMNVFPSIVDLLEERARAGR